MTFRPPFTAPIPHGSREIVVTYLTPERFEARPQIGIPITQEWHSLLRWLTWASFADSKRAHGAWCPTALARGVVKDGRGPVSLLVADVDDCGADGLDRSADALRPYAGAVVPTFSATREKPKHRIVLLPSRPLAAEEFPLAWTKMRDTLEGVGIVIDKGCKNPNRLYFACVARSPSAWLGARILTGEPVPVDAMLEAARAEAEDAARERARRPAPRPVGEQHRDKYIAAAISKAHANVAGASEGGRHDVLLREAFSLARLGLTHVQIADALLGAFVAAAGESRRTEGLRAIHDAVEARARGAS
jgi:hypothetical protein